MESPRVGRIRAKASRVRSLCHTLLPAAHTNLAEEDDLL